MSQETDTLTLTANKRLARSLQLDYAQAQVRAGKAVWESPAIMTWPAWLAECHRQLALRLPEPPPLLLTQTQSLALWRRVMAQTDAGRALLRPAETAVKVAQAWELLHAHGVALDQVAAEVGEDAGAFVDWAGRYRALCSERHWLDAAQLADWMQGVIGNVPLELPSHITLRGFDALTPQQTTLLEALEQQGVTTEILAFPQRAGRTQVQALADAGAEIRAAAAQARLWLGDRPDVRIGIVVPALEPHRAALSRALEAALTPASRLRTQPPAQPSFNLSLGAPLVRSGLVADALIGIQLMQGALDWQDAGRLLRSPYFEGFNREAGARARMDAALRKAGGVRWSLRALERAAETQGARRLRSALLACRHAATDGSATSAGAWAQHFSDWLSALGWCRGASLSSQDEQTRQAWFELLRGFASLASVAGDMHFHQALERLQTLAGATLFQPQSADAPVQVMGLLEAAGLAFDCLWVMGLEDKVWPPPATPNPFLPLSLQRRHQMPHASAEGELAYAQRVMRRLLGCADEIVLSWPQRDGDTVLAPSALLPADGAAQDTPPLPWQRRDGWLEVFDDLAPPPVPAGPVSGGSRVLTDQSACPFRAFAAHRLSADPLEQPQAALDAAGRGRLVHEALKLLWDDLQTQARLLQLDDGQLQQRITQAGRDARRRLERRLPRFPESFWRLEQHRLERLLAAWLAVEKARAPFSARGREQALTLTLAGLGLDLQIDRCDVLDDGSLVVVDYKTGGNRHSQSAWVGARPEEPQLPSYALALEAQGARLAGLAFAEVRPDDPGFQGVTALPDQLPGVRPLARWHRRPEGCDDVPALVAYWRRRLTALVADYKNGVADTDPRRAAECRYCHRQVLCRVREIQGGLPGNGEDTGE